MEYYLEFQVKGQCVFVNICASCVSSKVNMKYKCILWQRKCISSVCFDIFGLNSLFQKKEICCTFLALCLLVFRYCDLIYVDGR